MKVSMYYAALALLTSAVLAAPATAQQRSSEQRQRTDQQSQEQTRERQDRQRQMQQQRQQGQRQQAQSRQQGQWQLDPQGWVRIAADYDGDGRFDAVETIYAFDLERAKQASRQRQAQSGQQQAQSREQQDQYAAQYRGQDARQRQRTMRQHPSYRISGEVQDLRTVKLVGFQDQELIARVKTDEGRTAKVALGAKNQLQKLDLQEGDQITVSGKPGTINDRTMLVAQSIESGNKTVRLDRRSSKQGLKRFQGQVMQTRTAKLRNVDEKQIVAQVRLDNGQTLDVILGPQSKLEQFDLQRGDQVAMLAQRARLNGRTALAADQVSISGTQVSIDLPDRESFRRQQQSRQQDSQQQQRQQQQNRQRQNR